MSTEPLRSRRNHWMNQIAIHATAIPDAPALRYLGKTTSWGELHWRVGRLADALARRGVGPGDRVMILMLNNTEYLESVFAINTLGAIAVPVNFRLTPPEIAYLVADSGAAVIITDEALSPLAAAVAGQSDDLRTHIVVGATTGDGVLGYEDLIA